MPAKTTYNVSAEQFIQVWQSCSTVDEVARKLTMPKPIVYARASDYRKIGIKLKKMRRNNQSLDVERLNRLIEKLDAGRE